MKKRKKTYHIPEYIDPQTAVLESFRVTALKMKGSRCSIDTAYPSALGHVCGVRLVYRSSTENITLDQSFTISVRGDNVCIHTDIDLSKLRAGCVYWDLFTDIEHDGIILSLQASLDQTTCRKMSVLVYQYSSGDYISFPHISQSRTLAFTHREQSPYDDGLTRCKEVLAFCAASAMRRSLKKRKIWLVFEKFSQAAQDNGYYFFRYCMENLPENERKRIFYVIKKDSPDFGIVSKYGRQVVQFMSFRHLLYALTAKLYVGSDSKKHLYVWRPKPNLISRRMKNKDIHFLQHGVTALKRVDGIFGVNGSSPMTSITTTSRYEQKIMTEHFGYTEEQAPVVGFTRWDVLEDKRKPGDGKMILVMPTWRAWLEEKTDEDFLASDYFRNYMEMLSDESLRKCLEENDVRLIFFIHPKFADFLGQFSSDSANIEFVRFGERPLNEIMMKCSMLVTDYSSVCWDVYYMGKPVIFYQFDYDMYIENHGSYLDMEHDLFSERYTELPEVIQGIEKYIREDFRESERAKELRPAFFEYIDSENSKRTYEYLKSRGY